MVEIWGESLVQVPTTNGNCSYAITVNFSDGSTQSFTQQGNGGAINLFFTHSATDPVPTGASATETCATTVVDLVIKKGGVDVTNQTTNLVIGEPVQFTVEPGPNAQNMTISSVQWSHAYKSYTFTVTQGASVGLTLSTATFEGFFASPPARRRTDRYCDGQSAAARGEDQGHGSCPEHDDDGTDTSNGQLFDTS